MIANLLNCIVGLALVFVVVVHPTWAEQRYVPFLVFAAVILVLALWARASDARRWFSNVNVVMAIGLAILSTLPLATLANLTFWGGFWVGAVVATVALWAVLFRPKDVPAMQPAARAGNTGNLG